MNRGFVVTSPSEPEFKSHLPATNRRTHRASRGIICKEHLVVTFNLVFQFPSADTAEKLDQVPALQKLMEELTPFCFLVVVMRSLSTLNDNLLA